MVPHESDRINSCYSLQINYAEWIIRIYPPILLPFWFGESFLSLPKHIPIHVGAACINQSCHLLIPAYKYWNNWISQLRPTQKIILQKNWRILAWNIETKDKDRKVGVIKGEVPFVGHPYAVFFRFLQINWFLNEHI